MSDRTILQKVGVAWAVAVLPLLSQIHRLGTFGDRAPLYVTVAAAVGLVALAWRWWLGGIVAVASIAYVARSGEDIIKYYPPSTAWKVAVLFTVPWVLTGAATGVVALHRPGGPGTPRVAHPSLVLSLPVLGVAGWFVLRRGLLPPTACLALGLVLVAVAVVLPGPWAAVERATAPATGLVVRAFAVLGRVVERVLEVVARVVAVPVTVVGWLLLVLAPWAYQRITRSDPLWAPRRPESRWVRRMARTDLEVGSQWFTDPGPARQVARHRWARIVPTVVVLAVLGVLAQQLVQHQEEEAARRRRAREDAPITEPTGGRSAAMALEDEPWFEAWNDAYLDLQKRGGVRQLTGYDYPRKGVRTPYLTWRDGVRRSWTPPVGPCRPTVRIWGFGGSAFFGLGQRDQHTLPSEIARLAWAQGYRVLYENWAIPGDVLWIERNRMERAIASGHRKPDLATFYDGFNDIRAPEWMSMIGKDPTGTFSGLNDARVFPTLSELVVEERGGKQVQVAPVPDFDIVPADEPVVRRAALFQYTEGRKLVLRDLRAEGFDAMFFLQPWAYTRRPHRSGDFPYSEQAGARARWFRDHLPSSVVDVSGALDDSEIAVFTDDVHTNEAANPILAKPMWQALRPRVERVATDERGNGERC